MTALWIILLVVGILLLQVAIWVPLLVWLKRRQARAVDAIRAEVAASSEELRRGPEPALYRGATAEFSVIKGNGVLALTDRRVIFRKATGPVIEFPVDLIVGIREDKWFKGAYRGGMIHLIIELSSGAEVGFFVTDQPAWMVLLGKYPV